MDRRARIHDARGRQHDGRTDAVGRRRRRQDRDAAGWRQLRQVHRVVDLPLHDDRHGVVIARDLDHVIAVAAQLDLELAAVERELVALADADARVDEIDRRRRRRVVAVGRLVRGRRLRRRCRRLVVEGGSATAREGEHESDHTTAHPLYRNSEPAALRDVRATR
jgi:hypothetical protein